MVDEFKMDESDDNAPGSELEGKADERVDVALEWHGDHDGMRLPLPLLPQHLVSLWMILG